MRAYLELLHHPREDEGVDFWWMDWQQGTHDRRARAWIRLPWLNHLHFSDRPAVRERRPLVFSRWGGLGSHRYPIGFSGDSFALWPALRFQPRYTAAGANVGYGWWSHDIGGHIGAVEPELYVRWVQFGALSPVLRVHSTNMEDNERLPWRFGDEVLEHARAAFHLRYQLVPYLYTAAQVAAETGVAPVRPTSWTAPEHDGAYLARRQFLLGESLIAAPVVDPVDPATGLAPVDAWLPAGDWLERATGETFTGPRWVRLAAALGDVPLFLRPGTALPLAEVARTTADQPRDPLVLEVHPGDGGGRLFDDDGVSLDAPGTWTTFATRMPDPTRCELAVDGPPRGWTVRLPWTARPSRVTVDGRPHDDWSHDAAAHVTTVAVPAGSASLTVEADGPLVVRGPERNAALRARDLELLAADPDEELAVARRGGPALQVVEHTQPEEAATVLGRVVVSAPETGLEATVEATWTLERGAERHEATAEPRVVTGDAAMLDAPWAWDGSLTPQRWTVDVRVTWGDTVLERHHASGLVMPAFSAWRVALAGEDGARGDWIPWTIEPGDIDFPDLVQPADIDFRRVDPAREDVVEVADAAVAVVVPETRELAFAYAAGGPVSVTVDGAAVEADVTGHGPMPFYVPEPFLRRTGPVRLEAGTHAVVFTCPRDPVTRNADWYLWASAVDPATGEILLDVPAVSAGNGGR